MSNVRRVVGMLVKGCLLGACMAPAVMSGAAAFGLVAPEPEAIPRRWQLDVKTGPLRLARVAGADGAIKTYFYMTYRVVNKTGEDVLFAPSFELANGEGEVLRSGRGVSIEAANQIQADLQNSFLEDQISILGMLLQGEENARDGIVIWPANDLNVSEVTVYAAGFSGEVATVSAKDPKTGQTQRVPLYKTLMMRYSTGGDLTQRGSEPLEPYETKWVMR